MLHGAQLNPLLSETSIQGTHRFKKLSVRRTFNLQRARKVKAFTLLVLRKSHGSFVFTGDGTEGKHTCPHCPEILMKERQLLLTSQVSLTLSHAPSQAGRGAAMNSR